MRLFGFELTRVQKALRTTLSGVDSRGSAWWPLIRENVAGAWQSNVEIELANVLTYAPVYACVTLIASDIGKLRLRLVRQDANGIWHETESPSFSPLIRKPNHYQFRGEFIEQWVVSKLIHGNTYVLKQRDNRQVVRALYVLDPARVITLVAPDGSVFYQLKTDNLSGMEDEVTVPASEIIHDKMTPLYHPLVGISPITSCGIAAVEALRIQENSAVFFANGSQPGGVLTAPGHITQETAERVKDKWDTNFTGANAGKVAVLGDGLKYEPLAVKATDSQLVEQLNATAFDVCTAFRVPPYKINVGPPPNYNNIEALDVQYYSQCLQEKIEWIELLWDEGVGLAPDKVEGQILGVEFDLDDLFRMDTAGRVSAASAAIGSGGMSPNEARKKYFDLPPVAGGDEPYMQQQNYSLEALSKRDQTINELPPTPEFDPTDTVGPNRAEEEAEADSQEDAEARFLIAYQRKRMEMREHRAA